MYVKCNPCFVGKTHTNSTILLCVSIALLSDGLRRIKQEEGLGALWSGTGPSLLLAGNPAIQFAVYEAIKRFMSGSGQKVCMWSHSINDS